MTKTDQDHAAAAAGQRGEEGAGGDRGQVLSAAARLRQGEHRQPGEDGQAADGEPEARPGRAHQASNEKTGLSTVQVYLTFYLIPKVQTSHSD